MKLIEISLYDLHKDPESLYGYERADKEIPELFWDKYKNNKTELKKRESAIAKSLKYSLRYASEVLNGRFPKGEEIIAQDPSTAYTYALYRIKGRFKEAEANISKDSYYAYLYARDIIKGRFPEAEKKIARSKRWAYYYARDIIKGRWSEAEKAIAKNEMLYKWYKILVRNEEFNKTWAAKKNINQK